MTDREAMKIALDALEMHVLGFDGVCKMELAIEALEAALAQPDETETLKRCLFQMQEAAKALAQPEQEPFKPDWVIYRQGVADGAAQPEQEPVAWYAKDNLEINDEVEVIWNSEMPKYAHVWIPLYTAPPRKEWVGLTEDEVFEFLSGGVDGCEDINNIEEALRSKNT